MTELWNTIYPHSFILLKVLGSILGKCLDLSRSARKMASRSEMPSSKRERYSFSVPGQFPTWRKKNGVLGPGIAWVEHEGQCWVMVPTREELWILPVPGCKCIARFYCQWGNYPCVLAFTDPSALFQVWRNSRKDVYQPPLAANIEKKTTHLKEQKVFALIREILGRQPRLPMSNISTCWFSTQPWKGTLQPLMSPTLHLGHFPKILAHSSFCPTLKIFFIGPSDQTPHCGSIHSRSPLSAPGTLSSSDTGFYSSWDTVPTPNPRPLPRLFHLVCWNVLISLPYLFFWLSPLILSFSAQRLLYLQIGFLWLKALKPICIS